ncbi:hypothetical protein LTR09_003050 [Extremus antarcticus]|uniref:MPN domain-containing protein n=1 Tax=Extremus antarcticus TaxID=702011 RepID=A0AAJ0LUM9_9PEZI|nr:hypothetical protein LTR09_003050 [Extremus antarcticus]
MATSKQDNTFPRPFSTQELVTQALKYDFTNKRTLKSWLRASQLLATQAAICEQDGDLQKAFLYLIRHSDLWMVKMMQHPEYDNPEFKEERVAGRRAVQENLKKLEQWKPKITWEYEMWVKSVERRKAERQRVEAMRLSDQRESVASDKRRAVSLENDDGGDFARSPALDVNKNKKLAVDLAHREIRRRDATKQSTRQAGIPPDTVAVRRQGIVVEDEDVANAENSNGGGLGTTGEGVRQAGQMLQHPSQRQSRPSQQQQQKHTVSSYQYPSIPAREGTMHWSMPALQPTVSRAPPSVPAKAPLDRFINQHDGTPPAIPARPQVSLPPRSQTATPEEQPRPTFKATATTESGDLLRPVLLPPDLRTTFLNLAHTNTAANLETCGILCGTLVSNALIINHLIVPDQNSTSDTCDTTEAGDNELFDFCDNKNLLVCGWIHTHPSQSCFLSSRDLHTSSGYQVMLPEAIAIVCAPRHNPDWGVFRLTDPPGLQHVLQCEQKATFHQHRETKLYTDAGSPGHVVEGEGLRFEVVDMRKVK